MKIIKTMPREETYVFFGWCASRHVETQGICRIEDFPNYTCVMCNDNVLETRNQLLFHCDFAQAWKYLCPDWSIVVTNTHLDCISLLKRLHKYFYMDIII